MYLDEIPRTRDLPRPGRHNAVYAREGRCLVFASFSPALRDCHACRAIAYCKYYDHAGSRELDRHALAAWEDDGGKT